MSHPNEDLVRGLFLAQARGDVPALRTALAADIVWHVPGKNLVSRDYHGPDEVFGFWARAREFSGGTVRPQIIDVMASDGYAIALVRVFAEREGRKLDGSLQAWTYRIEDGKIAEVWFLVEDRYQVDAFWS